MSLNPHHRLFAARFALIGLLLGASTASSGTVSGPVTGGGHGWAFASPADVIDFSRYGYVEAEYFIEGNASAYAKNGSWTRDGVWSAVPSGTEAFKTRVLVLRPAKPQAFNGTVIVEWLNVSSGWDIADVLAHANQALLRGGHAWVGVSAQSVGVQLSPFSLKAWDSARYGSLAHPGDAYAYDIFTQVGRALRKPDGVDFLEGLAVSSVIATGHSQSANALTTYVNAVQPIANVFDGFVLHSRTAGALPLFPGEAGTVPAGSIIRTDTAVPVISLQDEWTLAVGAAWLNRQADSSRFRLWEVAGTGHIDRDSTIFTAPIVQRDLGFPSPACALPMNEAPMRYLVDTAIVRLTEWIAGREPPPHAPSFVQLAGNSILRDAFGNAKGGIRLPQLEVPTASHSGVGNVGPGPCPVAGITTPLDPQVLSYLYPDYGSYRSKLVRAIEELQRSGFLLHVDAQDGRAQ
jgi:hypothetical protein